MIFSLSQHSAGRSPPHGWALHQSCYSSLTSTTSMFSSSSSQSCLAAQPISAMRASAFSCAVSSSLALMVNLQLSSRVRVTTISKSGILFLHCKDYCVTHWYPADIGEDDM